MKLEAVNNCILIKQDAEGDHFTPSGIFIPGSNPNSDDEMISEPFTGVIKSIGNRVKLNLHEGDRIAFEDTSGIKIKCNNQIFILLIEQCILAKL